MLPKETPRLCHTFRASLPEAYMQLAGSEVRLHLPWQGGPGSRRSSAHIPGTHPPVPLTKPTGPRGSQEGRNPASPLLRPQLRSVYSPRSQRGIWSMDGGGYKMRPHASLGRDGAVGARSQTWHPPTPSSPPSRQHAPCPWATAHYVWLITAVPLITDASPAPTARAAERGAALPGGAAIWGHPGRPFGAGEGGAGASPPASGAIRGRSRRGQHGGSSGKRGNPTQRPLLEEAGLRGPQRDPTSPLAPVSGFPPAPWGRGGPRSRSVPRHRAAPAGGRTAGRGEPMGRVAPGLRREGSPGGSPPGRAKLTPPGVPGGPRGGGARCRPAAIGCMNERLGE